MVKKIIVFCMTNIYFSTVPSSLTKLLVKIVYNRFLRIYFYGVEETTEPKHTCQNTHVKTNASKMFKDMYSLGFYFSQGCAILLLGAYDTILHFEKINITN